MSKRLFGVVKWWNETRGYGYITVATDDGKYVDYFAHWQNITSHHRFKKLHQGWVVSFLSAESEKGLYAIDIKLEYKSMDEMLRPKPEKNVVEALVNVNEEILNNEFEGGM